MEEVKSGWIRRNGIGLGSLLVLSLLGVAGLIYLGTKESNEKQSFLTVQKPLLESQPVKQVNNKAQATVLSPSFDIVSIDQTGKLVAAGRGEAGWIIQLKSETQIVGEAKADENREWVLTPEASLPPGEHTLSLLAIDPSGQRSIAGKRENTVLAPRREIVRQTSTLVAGPAASGLKSKVAEASTNPGSDKKDGKQHCAFRVVKRGDTLWDIARTCYGQGTKYSKIFQSNRSVIRSPDLIFPDQRFALPY